MNAETPTSQAHLIVMGFFAKMQMRGERVLEHVHDQIARQA